MKPTVTTAPSIPLRIGAIHGEVEVRGSPPAHRLERGVVPHREELPGRPRGFGEVVARSYRYEAPGFLKAKRSQEDAAGAVSWRRFRGLW